MYKKLKFLSMSDFFFYYELVLCSWFVFIFKNNYIKIKYSDGNRILFLF